MTSDAGFFPMAPTGEAVSIAERVVVSPCWGRLHPQPLAAGETVDVGAVIGHLHEGGQKIPLVCHARATFIAWFVRRGERVSPGTRLASFRVKDE